MTTKRVLCPERLRHVPRQFSWIDQRLVRDGHCARCGPNTLALYLLLVTVADAQGLSYYSDRTAASLLAIDQAALGDARQRLLQAGLIAYEPPLYQVLSLPQRGDCPAPKTSSEQSRRSGQPMAVSDILRQMFENPGEQRS